MICSNTQTGRKSLKTKYVLYSIKISVLRKNLGHLYKSTSLYFMRDNSLITNNLYIYNILWIQCTTHDNVR